MRPDRLVLRALGPYAGEEVVDFGALGARTLFLIHGATGAGKSMLLDAMCFALYGQTATADRDLRQMRSALAPLDVATEVTFDFRLGTEAYRVTRRSELERPKKRGEGMRREPPTATLWKRTGATGVAEEGKVLATSVKRVGEEVTRLLGLGVEQFRQVIVIPQGKFRDLLLAGSTERQNILQSLFGTVVYRRIEEALKEQVRTLRAQDDTLATRQAQVLEQAGVDSVRTLESRLVDLETALAAAVNARQEAGRAVDVATQALMGGQRAAAALRERDEAAAALALLEARCVAVATERATWMRARKASTLDADVEGLARREEEAAKAIAAGAGAQERAATALAARDLAAQALERESARETERQDSARDLARLEAIQAAAPRLEATRAAMAARDQEFTDRREALAGAVCAVDALRKRKASTRDALEQSRVTASELGSCEEAEKAARQAIETKGALAAIDAAIAGAGTDLERIERAAQEADADLAASREQANTLEIAWIAGQAALLAEHLEDGRPCPVCGSPQHPAPAVAQDPLPRKDALTRARREIESASQRRDAARLAAQDARTALALLEGQRMARVAATGAATGEPADQDERLRAIQARLGVVRAAARSISALERKLSEEELEEVRLESARVAAVQAQESAGRERETALVTLAAIEGALPAELRPAGALTAALTAARRRGAILVEALKSASEAAAEAERHLAAADAHRKATSAMARDAEAARDVARAQLEARARALGFESPADAKLARRSGAQIDHMEATLARFDEDLAAARERLDRASRAAAGLAPVDLGVFEQALTGARETLEARTRTEGTLGAQLGSLQSLRGALADLEARREAVGQSFGPLARIAEVAGGTNRERITFERFVLAALLDDVLAVASQRLALMSRGRYRLVRSRAPGDMRVAGGLDLDVEDANTGTYRPVATLSGGESFLASLSLALGLADVVQSHAGGIRLDTIFVDEGFGSLDPEALDLALRALQDLQRGGRLVGIISHVPELAACIPARFEVVPGLAGSHIRLTL